MIVLAVGSFGLVHSCLNTSSRELLFAAPSPGRKWQAAAYEAPTGDPARSRFEVRIAAGDEWPEFGVPVWQSLGVRPVALSWRGSDSLEVVVRDDAATRTNQESVAIRPRNGVDVRTVLAGSP